MPSKKGAGDSEKLNQMVDEARRKKLAEDLYREKALKLFPWVCGRCGREFAGKKLRELTVHHKDHNHNNNPPDGGNWELLCIYCHDNEHSRLEMESEYGVEETKSEKPSLSSKPFAALEKLLKGK
ncbi:MAG: YajD family HNH nuclease [Pseudomonadota bacterium]